MARGRRNNSGVPSPDFISTTKQKQTDADTIRRNSTALSGGGAELLPRLQKPDDLETGEQAKQPTIFDDR